MPLDKRESTQNNSETSCLARVIRPYFADFAPRAMLKRQRIALRPLPTIPPKPAENSHFRVERRIFVIKLQKAC